MSSAEFPGPVDSSNVLPGALLKQVFTFKPWVVLGVVGTLHKGDLRTRTKIRVQDTPPNGQQSPGTVDLTPEQFDAFFVVTKQGCQ